MFVSIVICTYNRADSLERALGSLACQTLPSNRFEVVVVDDGSTDGTEAVCKAMSRRLHNLKYISSGTNVGTSRARNLGVGSAKGDRVLFTDDDCIAREDWVERMSSALEREPVVAGAIRSDESDYLKLCHNIAQFHPFMTSRNSGPTQFIAGANMGFRRSVLLELQGFYEGQRLAQDMEIVLRARSAGYHVFFAPDAIVTHDHDRLTLAGLLKYAAMHASNTIVLRCRYRSLLHTPFVLRSSLLILLAAPLIALHALLHIYLLTPGLARHCGTAPLVYALKLAWCWGAARGLRTCQTGDSLTQMPKLSRGILP